ncbi:MAG: hypothetical protein LDL41_25180, partial [Coleofasciculus sp. S288]|nr:hypothetical protein [Coleofasciculus sp. S288]
MRSISLTSRVTQLIFTTGILLLIQPMLAANATMTILDITEGKAWIKPMGSSKFSEAFRSQQLKYEDVLKTDRNSTVTIKCSKNRVERVIQNVQKSVSNICPSNANEREITRLRSGGNNPQIPYIISPRYTLLLNNQPTFRWNAVEDVESYTVTLYEVGVSEDHRLWEESVRSTAMQYPPDQQPLKTGVDYKLVVKADNGRSSKEEEVDFSDYDSIERGVSGLNFRLIEQNLGESVQSLAEENTQQQSAEDGKLLIQAYLYAGNGLFAEAIEILEAAVETGTQAPDISRSLGDFYAWSGLNLLAEKFYLKAIQLSELQQDEQEKALAQHQLGQMYLEV